MELIFKLSGSISLNSFILYISIITFRRIRRMNFDGQGLKECDNGISWFISMNMVIILAAFCVLNAGIAIWAYSKMSQPASEWAPLFYVSFIIGGLLVLTMVAVNGVNERLKQRKISSQTTQKRG